MRVLVAVDVADLLHGAGHLAVSAEIVEEHEPRIEIDAFEDIVGDHDLKQRFRRLILAKHVVDVADELVAREQVLVVLPLIEDVRPLVGRTYRVEHIPVALGMYRLLESLDIEAEIHFVGGDVLSDVGQIGRLDGVEENEETEHLVVRPALRGRQRFAAILDVLAHVDLFGDPEVVHRLAVPAAHPRVLEVVEVVEIGGVAAYHAALGDFDVAVFVEERFEFKIMFFHNSSVYSLLLSVFHL